MKRKVSYLFLFLIPLISCNSDNESDNGCDIPPGLVDCFAPITHTGIDVYFVDKETEENSFVSGALTLDDIVITDSDNTLVEKELQIVVLHESDLSFGSHFLVIRDNFKSGENKYSFKIKNNLEFDMVLNVNNVTAGCCLGLYLDDLQIQGADHNLEYSIKLPIVYL